MTGTVPMPMVMVARPMVAFAGVVLLWHAQL